MDRAPGHSLHINLLVVELSGAQVAGLCFWAELVIRHALSKDAITLHQKRMIVRKLVQKALYNKQLINAS